MQTTTLGRRRNVLVRRQILEPGEASPWHTDPFVRFTVVVRGAELAIEFRDGEAMRVSLSAGASGWDEPEPRVHRAVNVGATTYEEIVVFLLDRADDDPQPPAA